MLVIEAFFLLLVLIANGISWRVYTIVRILSSLEVYESITRKWNKIWEKFVHVLELFPGYDRKLLHHFKLLIYSLRYKIKGTMRMIHWYLFIIRLFYCWISTLVFTSVTAFLSSMLWIIGISVISWWDSILYSRLLSNICLFFLFSFNLTIHSATLSLLLLFLLLKLFY